MGSDWEWGKENGLWGDDGMPYGIDSPDWDADGPDHRLEDWPDDRPDDDWLNAYHYRANIFQNLQATREHASQYEPIAIFVRNPIGSGFILKDEKSILLNCAKDDARTKQWYIDVVQEMSYENDGNNLILNIESENEDIDSEDYFLETSYIRNEDILTVNHLIADLFDKIPNLTIKFKAP